MLPSREALILTAERFADKTVPEAKGKEGDLDHEVAKSWNEAYWNTLNALQTRYGYATTVAQTAIGERA